MRRLRLAALGLAAVLALGSALPAWASEPAARYFPETRQLVVGPFLEFVERHGLELLGPPLSGAYVEQGHLVQWFRNGRLELRDGRVALSQLGGYLLGARPARRLPPPSTQDPAVAYFEETGQLVGHAILAFYRAHGGRELFGLPLTPQIGNQQWFERARLEWDPASGVVRLGELGREALARAQPDSVAFDPGWIGTHRPARWRSGAEESELPAWRALFALHQEGDWLRAWDPLLDRFGFVEGGAVGPIDPPAWHQALGQPERLNLPGRVVRSRVNVPWLGDLQHNQPVVVRLAYVDEHGQQVYVSERGDELTPETVRLPQRPDRSFRGRWIDVSLAEPVLVTAYEDQRPVYSALAVKGAGRWTTPTGVFRIWKRVANETMDSETIGIPRDARDGYYLKNVLFTQYFSSDGAALHYNYWRSDWGYAGSHGCLGLNYDDSKWFWDWASLGTVVYVHN